MILATYYRWVEDETLRQARLVLGKPEKALWRDEAQNGSIEIVQN